MKTVARLLVREAANTAERAIRERDEAIAERDALVEYVRALGEIARRWLEIYDALPEPVRQRIEESDSR